MHVYATPTRCETPWRPLPDHLGAWAASVRRARSSVRATLVPMCRYGMSGPYRGHWACFACRKSFKWPHDRHADRATLPSPTCPPCGGPLESMGLDFRAPAANDLKQWQKVRLLADHGFRYFSCGCGGPGPRPAELRDVAAFLANELPNSAGEALLQTIAARAEAHRNGAAR